MDKSHISNNIVLINVKKSSQPNKSPKTYRNIPAGFYFETSNLSDFFAKQLINLKLFVTSHRYKSLLARDLDVSLAKGALKSNGNEAIVIFVSLDV